MIVIALEGTHGSGKSTLVHQFARLGFDVLDEAFLDMPAYALHPQTMTMECVWLANWYMRLLRLNQEARDAGNPNKIYIADRSPYSAAYYANNGAFLEPVIRTQQQELRAAGIELYTIHISVEPETLWDRIQARLAREPARAAFNENSRAWMDRTLAWYNNMPWDYTIRSENLTPESLLAHVVGVLEKTIENWAPAQQCAGQGTTAAGWEGATEVAYGMEGQREYA